MGDILENYLICELSDNEVDAIRRFIKSKEDEIKRDSFNTILRDDIFRLLAKHECVVVFFPKGDEDNNGFNVKYFVSNEWKHFVYINTAQYKEKQIFTAAHELGHVWDIIAWMNKEGLSGDEEWEEVVINRFAAELLMPVGEFNKFTEKIIGEICEESGKQSVSGGDVIHAITAIMNEFFTPYKSVVYRLYELGFMSKINAEALLCNHEAFHELSRLIAHEKGYSRLYQPPDERKWIDGLKDMLDRAKNNNAMPEKWLESFYNLFDLEQTRNDDKIAESFPDIINIGGETD